MNKVLKSKVNDLDVETLACKITGLDYDEIGANTDTIDEKLNDEFNIGLFEFREIVSRLLPLIDVGRSK